MIPKFRVWDTVKKAMSEVQAIVYTEEKVYPIYFKEIRRYIPFSEAILMQSTGLLDNSTPKKEIFGNDIVEWKHNGTGRLNRGIVKRDVDFGFFGVQVCRFDDLTPFGHLANQKVTVLGNIYENKELLEELK